MKKIIVFATIPLLLVSCKNQTIKQQRTGTAVDNNIVTLTDAQLKNGGILTGKIQQRVISTILKLNGKIDVPPQNTVSISVPLGGYLKSTKLLPGMHIVKGEALAVIEDPQYIQLQQDYLTAKADFVFDESEYNRQRELNANKASSDKVFEQTKAAYQKQHILIKSLEQKLKLIGLNPEKITPANISKSINVYSPITGFVSAVNANIGKYITPSDVLFELVNPSDIHLSLTVFEKDVNNLAIGQKISAYSNANPEKKYPCSIILISKSLSNENATQVHCHFEQYDKSLLPGMYMNADVEILGNNVTALPEDAIVQFENKHYLFIDKGNNHFEMRAVQSGNSENGYTEIVDSGELVRQSIVIKGAYNLLMALKNAGKEE